LAKVVRGGAYPNMILIFQVKNQNTAEILPFGSSCIHLTNIRIKRYFLKESLPFYNLLGASPPLHHWGIRISKKLLK